MRRLLIILGLLLAPVATIAPQPAAAQAEGSTSCGVGSKFSERWRTRSYRGTTTGQEFTNSCPYPIKLYYCLSYDPNPESCASLPQFSAVVLQPGATTRVYPTERNTTQYIHDIQCNQEEQLVDWRSQYTQQKGLRCKAPLPANVNRSAYPGTGATPNPSAPKATWRNAALASDYITYPSSFLGTLVEVRVVANIGVNPTGRATGCQITSSSGFYDFDMETCSVFMRYARFKPATDASGTAVESFYEAKMLWAAP